MSAVLAALYEDEHTAVRVRTRLVSDGFPTDRVELTSRRERGQAGLMPADSLPEQLETYFRELFDQENERRFARCLASNVQTGRAVIVVHPRGEIETNRALEILEEAGPLELREHDLKKQQLEHAASPKDAPVLRRILIGNRAS